MYQVHAVQFLGMSIWTWKDRGVAQTVVQVVTHPAQEAASWTAVWLPILMMYSPVQVVCTALALSFMVAPAAFAAALWVGGLAVYYAVTLPGAPEHTGQPSCLRNVCPCSCCCCSCIWSLVHLLAMFTAVPALVLPMLSSMRAACKRLQC